MDSNGCLMGAVSVVGISGPATLQTIHNGRSSRSATFTRCIQGVLGANGDMGLFQNGMTSGLCRMSRLRALCVDCPGE
jgi:hypothetical protein